MTRAWRRAARLSPLFAPVPPVEAPTAAAPARAHAGKWRPDREVADSIVGGFARQFQKDLSAASADFKWTDTKLEGFDWASSAGFWTSRYIVAMRGFGKADAQNAKKFANYCNLAIENSVHPLKHTYFLFFFAFQKATDQQVPVLLRRFCANENNERAPGPACIVLTDVVRAKSLLCGPRPHDSRYEQLLGALGLTRSA